MTNEDHLISTADDFENVAIYGRAEKKGPVYSIVFENIEIVKFNSFLVFLAITSLLLLIGVSLIYGVEISKSLGVDVHPFPFVLFFVFVILFAFKQPSKVDRAIEFDTAAEMMRIKKNGHVEIERPYGNMESMSLEEHPDVEKQRQYRINAGKNKPNLLEKQFCVVGWFGIRGAKMVVLITRAGEGGECRLFLHEVQQAIEFVRDMCLNPPHAAATDGAEPSQTDSGIKPPLD
jgi:hypothetical protein